MILSPIEVLSQLSSCGGLVVTCGGASGGDELRMEPRGRMAERQDVDYIWQ